MDLLLSLLYAILRAVLRLMVPTSSLERVLRHELGILRRQISRPRFRRRDRMSLAAASHLLSALPGNRSSSPRRCFSVGIESSSAGNGPTGTSGDRDAHPSPATPATSSWECVERFGGLIRDPTLLSAGELHAIAEQLRQAIAQGSPDVVKQFLDELIDRIEIGPDKQAQPYF